MRGYLPGRFSFNVKGGRCEACSGDGTLKIEMNFLPDVYVPCEVCKGARFNRETLEVHYKGRTVAEVLDMPIEEAADFFAAIPAISRYLRTLTDVGLGYVRLGQPATTLSGGEAQRVKLASELQKRSNGRSIYVLDEPTTGLHFEDIRKLLLVLQGLVDKGNSVIVIEHNLDVIKSADWLIDMGPEGGFRGGTVVAEGTPEFVATVPESHTGRYLAKILDPDAVAAAAAPKKQGAQEGQLQRRGGRRGWNLDRSSGPQTRSARASRPVDRIRPSRHRVSRRDGRDDEPGERHQPRERRRLARRLPAVAARRRASAARVQLVHGASEHSGRYGRLAARSPRAGWPSGRWTCAATAARRRAPASAGSARLGVDACSTTPTPLHLVSPRSTPASRGCCSATRWARSSRWPRERDGGDLAGLVALRARSASAPQLADSVTALEEAVAAGMGDQPLDALGAFNALSSRPAPRTTGCPATRPRSTPTSPTRSAATTCR